MRFLSIRITTRRMMVLIGLLAVGSALLRIHPSLAFLAAGVLGLAMLAAGLLPVLLLLPIISRDLDADLDWVIFLPWILSAPTVAFLRDKLW